MTALLGGYDTGLSRRNRPGPTSTRSRWSRAAGGIRHIFTRGNKYLFGTLATVDDLGKNTMDFLKYWIDQGKLPKPLTIALVWENTDHGKDYLPGCGQPGGEGQPRLLQGGP